MASPQQPQQPSPEQLAQMQAQFQQHVQAESAKRGITPQQYIELMKKEQAKMQQQQGGQPQQGGQQQQQQQQMQGGQMPIQPGPPKPEAIAVAQFLKSQDLKSRACIFEEKRRELFKVKRALRALESPAYAKVQSKKNSLLPPVTDRASAESAFKLLPMSMLALRVSKFDPATDNPPHGHPGHVHGADEGSDGKKKKKKKGELWTVKIEQHQDAVEEHHYMWFYEGAQWRQKAYAALALVGILAVVLFPLWPYTLRRGVWYVSMAALGLLAAFFGLAIVRLILFLVSLVAVPPGIWLYPNLFEDVGFFDSFRPLWAWRETKESLAAKKAAKKVKRRQKRLGKPADEAAAEKASNGAPAAQATPVGAKSGGVVTSGADTGTPATRRNLSARVEEVEDDE